MGKPMKIWLIAAALLIFVGLTVFAVSMSINGWDFTKLATEKYVTNTYELSEDFSGINVITDTADVILMPSDDGKAKVVCYEDEKEKHTVNISNGTLLVEITDTKVWYEHIGIGFKAPKITVYLPEGEFADLAIETDTGDVDIPNGFGFNKIFVSVSTGDVTVSGVKCSGEISVNVSTGNVKLTDTTCKNVVSNGSTGDITFKTFIAAEKITVERSTGDVSFDGADAKELSVKTDTGDVTGSLLTEKVFITKSDTGDIEVPKTVNGGRCEISSDTGDIRIRIQ